MNKTLRDLKLQQLDAMLASWKRADLGRRPNAGWVRAIREALGMSATAFARRLGMTHAGVRKLEAAEAADAITLASLRKLAHALDCELQYALVPRTSLNRQLQQRAQAVARDRLRNVSHSMVLEGQAVQADMNTLQLDILAQELLDGSRRELW